MLIESSDLPQPFWLSNSEIGVRILVNAPHFLVTFKDFPNYLCRNSNDNVAIVASYSCTWTDLPLLTYPDVAPLRVLVNVRCLSDYWNAPFEFKD